MRNNGAVRCIARVNLATPNVTWTPHGSGDSMLEHEKLLPRLQSAEVPLGDMHTARRQIWGDGPYPTLVHESWQSADAGAVTLPHVDDDNQSPRVTMGTYIVVVEGSELIVAWKRTDMHETDAIRTLPLLDSLHTVPSLTILRAVAGDVIYLHAA